MQGDRHLRDLPLGGELVVRRGAFVAKQGNRETKPHEFAQDALSEYRTEILLIKGKK